MTERQKLEQLISEIVELINNSAKYNTPDFQAWYSKAERFLIKKFGMNSYEHKKLKATKFMPVVYITDAEVVDKCREGLEATELMFRTYIEEMDDDENIAVEKVVMTEQPMNKVFIVHGHDGELKHAVARLVEKQGLKAIILSEQANKSKTIIEKFEENSDVSGAICLFTADDLGRAKSILNEQSRARQNVVFETGYFMGKLGRDHVVIIAENGLELPSDMQGIVYTEKNNWEVEVLKNLKAMGYTIDFNKLYE